MKTCTRCGELKPLEEFKIRKELKSGRSAECKECNVKRARLWAEKNKEKRSSYLKSYLRTYTSPDPDKRKAQWRKYKLRQRYGLNEEQLQQMLLERNNQCDICKCEFVEDTNDKVGRYNVDHCHTTGRLRGVLCARCNMVLGKIQDDPELLQKMIDYLKSH